MAAEQPRLSRPRFWTEFHMQATEYVDDIIKETENYLTQVFGYPKAFLFVLAKASFGCNASPVVDYDVFIKQTWKFLNSIQDIINNLSPVSSEVTIHTGNQASFNHVATQTEEEEGKRNNLIQITAGSDEIQRRIQSFIQKKRQEVDAYNRREFCVFLDDRRDSTCARTDAAYVPRHGKKSLLKTYRVYNKIDSAASSSKPDANTSWRKKVDCVWEPSHPSAKLSLKHIPPETYERIENIDQHLMKKKQQRKKRDNNEQKTDVLGKIKELEDRILYLEGISPEYIYHDVQDTGQDKRRHPYKPKSRNNFSKDEIYDKDFDSLNKRIMELKQTLLKSKSSKIT